MTFPVPEISDVQTVFPADALDWMPPMTDIPDEFKKHYGNAWVEIVSAWFYNGLPATVKFYPRKGIDPEKAVRALGATLGSYAPKHEHKIAAAAYMASCWFKRVKGWKK